MNIACFMLVLPIVRQRWVDTEYKVIPRLRVLKAFEKALQFAEFRRQWVKPQCTNVAVFPQGVPSSGWDRVCTRTRTMVQCLRRCLSERAMKWASWYLVRERSVMSSTTKKQVTHMTPAVACTLIISSLYAGRTLWILISIGRYSRKRRYHIVSDTAAWL